MKAPHFACATQLFLLLSLVAACGQRDRTPRLTVSDRYAADAFPLVSDRAAAPVVLQAGEAEVVGVAAAAFAGDVEAVTGCRPVVVPQAGAACPRLLVGTLGVSPLVDSLAAVGAIDAEELRGKWESFSITLLPAPQGGAPCLAVCGSDARGTAYGLFELSRCMGVSPWHWWADVVPSRRDCLYVQASAALYGPPSVKYRGIFINDEDWGLQPWAAQQMDTLLHDIGPRTYERVCELLLRLRANFLWPAMHPCTKAFWYYKENAQVARRYGIVLGSSHCEPLLRNNVDEWVNNFEEEYGEPRGDWSWRSNRAQIERYWRDRVGESARNEAIYTVGMRGIHDSSMPGYATEEEKLAALGEVITVQRSLLAQGLHRPADSIPQLFCPYKEALTLYRKGLCLPHDVTLLWPDDNFGHIRQLSTPAEQQRPGGGGVYYHLSYWGSPCDYLWLSSVSPAQVSYEMSRAYAANCKEVWVFNVGDIKPCEAEMQFALELAWDAGRWQPHEAHRFARCWARETFGDELADEVAAIKNEYYRLAAQGKPEHLHTIDFTPRQRQRRLADYRALCRRVSELEKRIEPRLGDAYYQLIAYPCYAACAMNEKTLLAAASLQLAAAGQGSEALLAADSALAAYRTILQLTERYNNQVAGGKWRGMMDCAPRGLKQFYEPRVATASEVAAIPDSAALAALADDEPLLLPAHRYVACGNSADIRRIAGLGVSDTAVTVWPLCLTQFDSLTIDCAPYVEYRLPLLRGENRLRIKCLPTFPLTRDTGLSLALSVDGAAPVWHNMAMEERKAPWNRCVLDGYLPVEQTLTVPCDTTVTLRIAFARPGVVLSELQLMR